MVTPELRKASSRRRCSSVAKSNSVLVKVCGRGQEGHFGAAHVRRIGHDLQRRLGFAVAEAHVVFLAVAPDAQVEDLGQRIDDRHADAMQAAGDLVGVLLELSARMQLGHDDFGGGDAFAFVDAGGNAAAIVAHGAGAVGIQRHVDAVGIAGQRLVDGIVDDFVDHVMQARAVIGVADIHARPLAHGIEALQHLDAVGVIFVRIWEAVQMPWFSLR